jgi:GT2 family glycosyltransferase
MPDKKPDPAELDLSVIIVSWNVKNFLRACLQSIYDTIQGLHFEVFVVDNASHDGSPQMMTQEFPGVQLIANKQNVGFGSANNQALRLANGRYVLLINPDTVVPAGAIKKMIDFMEQHARAGLVGPELVNENGQLLTNWVRWSPRHLAEFLVERIASLMSGQTRILFPQPRRVRILTGACWMTRYESMAGIGFYDEDFFMYAEEPDICTRMHSAGWEIWLLRDIVVTHYKGQSVRERPWGWHLPLFARNMALWLKKRWQAKQSVGS